MILDLIVQALLYPGLLFTIVFIIFTQWYARKLSARIQYRRGPIHAGPAGFLQPLADLLKLVAKRDIVNKYSLNVSPVIVISLAIGFLILVQLALPVAYKPLYARYDSLAILYFMLIAPFAIAYLAAAHPNPYTSIGVARFLAQLVVAEPLFAITVITPLIIGARLGGEYSIYLTSILSPKIWSSGLTSFIAMLLSAIAGFIALLAVLMVKPFDTPEAESEIYWGVFTEVGGSRLALGFFLKFAERIVFPMLYACLFLGCTWPVEPSNWLLSTIVVYLKTLLVFTVLTIIDNVMPRYKPEQVVVFLLKYGYPPALLGLLLALV